ncbi:sugar ABC transporter permease [Oscillospiraceae bacterium DSM 107454]|uniref:Sugar ABC transporter permease n=2 Tax=Ructibacterium gallinarum TaxID=2779355 RepID=A0A9D5R9P7_9FIRM|nr:sugar ABC transporter permease [Ructibacterium gallinarum]
MAKKRLSMNVQCYLMIALPLIGFFVFTLYPILWTFRWSVFSYNGVPSETRFIGLDNFIRMFTVDLDYWKAWLNTFKFAICKIPLEYIIAMIAALLLNQKRLKLKGMYRAVYYLPSIISAVVIGLIFSNLFGFFGLMNGILIDLGIVSEGIDWFAGKGSALAVLVISSIWNTFGVNVMYLMAAFANVPEDVYESAKLDGASSVRMFFSITLPMIAPIFQIMLLLSLIGTLSINEFILVMTGGGPGGSTMTVMAYLTQKFVPGFTSEATPALGYGCALSVVTTILFAVISFIYNAASKKMNDLY